MSAAPSRRPDVDVIIVAHDSGKQLEAAVASAESQVDTGRIVVVDAGSIDGAVDAVAAAHPDVRVIRTDNRGFAAGNNAGLIATCGEFVLLLNPDAVLEERCIDPLVARARSNRTAGIVAPRVTDPDGTTQEGSFGPFPNLRKALILRANKLMHRMMKRKGASLEVHGTTPVDWVTGACMLVRRAAIEKVGPMDESFFLYYEDVEWCHRMRDGGWAVLIEPSSVCVHVRGGSGGDSPEALEAYRASFYRYCELYHLRAYAFAARMGLTVRRAAGGRG
jgi:N-acetylglucosaminyl-diphospho-decaprenol L-rhamnosyltransferase